MEQLAKTLLIKQVVQTEKITEKEVTLPYFCFDGQDQYFKVIDNLTVILASKSTSFTRLSKSEYWLQKTEIAKCSQITEGEFNQAYHEALMEIGKYVPAPEVPFELVK